MNIIGLIPSSRLVKNVVRDVLYGCWCSGKRIGGATVPPYAMLSCATCLKQEGYSVSLLDANAEQIPWDEILLRSKDADVVFLNSATMSITEDAELLSLLRKQNPALKVAVFGSHPTFMPRETLALDVFDAAIRGEPEQTLVELVRAWDTGTEWRNLPGISHRADDRTVVGDIAPPRLDLETMPFLDVSMLPAGIEYFNPVVHRFPYITTVTSRGCPGKCTFCTAPTFYGTKIRAKRPERVVDEMAYYVEQGYGEVYFRDETFTYNKKRALRICELIGERNLDVSWIANARVGTMTPELAQAMRGAGCHLVKFGVESGVQEILDRSRKGIRVERTLADFKAVRDAGMDSHAHMMLGMPGETRDTLERTIRFVRELDPTTASFGICTPFAGTPLFEEIQAMDGNIGDGTQADLLHEHRHTCLNELYTELTEEELESALKRAYRGFYLRPSYIAKRLFSIRSATQLRNLIIAGLNIFSFGTGKAS